MAELRISLPRKFRHWLRIVVTIAALAVVLWQWYQARHSSPVPSADPNATVITHVVDGDTVDVSVDGVKNRVRLIGIDTPETVKPNTPVQCYGPEASNRARQLLTNQAVTLTIDPVAGDKDEYGRILRYIQLADGSDYGETTIH